MPLSLRGQPDLAGIQMRWHWPGGMGTGVAQVPPGLVCLLVRGGRKGKGKERKGEREEGEGEERVRDVQQGQSSSVPARSHSEILQQKQQR